MSTVPQITIFVRHLPSCKYAANEFAKRCKCRKHLRWTSNGTQYRRAANTNAWSEAEEAKRALEDQFSGSVSDARETANPRTIEEALKLFLQDKKMAGITDGVVARNKQELARLQAYCEQHGTFTVSGITAELLSGYAATWAERYPSSTTRYMVRGRVTTFLRYCFEAQWLARIPRLPRITIDEPATEPLTDAEYNRLLTAVPKVFESERSARRVRGLFQLMRWSGLAIRDAVTLKRSEMVLDEADGLYSIVTTRQKTGVSVNVPIPPDVADELLAIPNETPEYFFWTGRQDAQDFSSHWGKTYVAPVFDAAEIPDVCSMKSHRLRDTFAVDLLAKGVPLQEVSKLLGHESIKTTEKYYAKWNTARQARSKSLVVASWIKPEARENATEERRVQ